MLSVNADAHHHQYNAKRIYGENTQNL